MLYRLFPLTILALLLSCQSQPQKPPAPGPTDVTEYVVELKTLPVVFDFIGFAESSHPVEIRARVEGFLDKIAYDEGQRVGDGDLLFQLDPKQFDVKVEQAKGEVAKQEALLENARLTVNRLTPLYEQKAASKKDLDSAIANHLSAQASLQSAHAFLLDAEINLGYTTIKSPIDGVADRSKFRQGALINPNSLLTTVSVLDPIWIYFTISDNDLVRTQHEAADRIIILPHKDGMMTLPKDNAYDVEAVLGDGTVLPYRGRVNFSAPTFDQSTGTLLARAELPNPRGDLRPGQFIRVKVLGASRPNAMIVPRRALMQKRSGLFVYLIGKDDKVVQQDVAVDDWYGDFQIVTTGLKSGGRVIVDGINKVRPGGQVHSLGPWKAPEQHDKKPEPTAKTQDKA